MPLLHSVSETAQRLSLGRTKVYELISDGRLQLVKVGRKSLITETSIEAFVTSLVEATRHDIRP